MLNDLFYKMKNKVIAICFLIVFNSISGSSQSLLSGFTKADTLRGSISSERAWWDVLYYDLHVAPNLINKTIRGYVDISYKVLGSATVMQIDLQQPLVMDSVFDFGVTKSTRLTFQRNGSVVLINFSKPQKIKTLHIVRLYYSGTPQEAKNPPWDGGITWTNDKMGNPLISSSCQGLGASVWWPCKDHQSDKPDHGAKISITTPDTLMDVSNGQLNQVIEDSSNHTKTWIWEVKNPINNYSLSMNIAKYVSFSDTLNGEGGILPLHFYVLSNHLKEAQTQFLQAKTMLRCFEFWFGKYPFYEDGYKLVEVPYLGMEHQSAVAYGNRFKNGYLGRDLSGTGWGLKWDFIIVHESGHEWFGNNITSKDIADMWVHESFTNYSETLFTQWVSGKQAGYEYNFGIRKNIANQNPIISPYGVNKESEGTDKYYKGSNLIHLIRNSMDNDSLFRGMLRNLNSEFYHQTINSADIEKSISKFSGYDYSKVLDQYLRNISVPELQLVFNKELHIVSFRWKNCVTGFNLPIIIKTTTGKRQINPVTSKWNSIQLTDEEAGFFTPAAIEFKYYIKVKELTSIE